MKFTTLLTYLFKRPYLRSGKKSSKTVYIW